MPAIPFGGLSFFLNLIIVVLGLLIHFFERRGFPLRWLHYIFSLLAEKKFDSSLRRIFGYAIMLSIFFLLFASTAASFVKRMQVETNVGIIQEKIVAYYQNNEDARVQNQTKSITL